MIIIPVKENEPIESALKKFKKKFDDRKKKYKEIAMKRNPETKGITLSTADALLIAMYGKEVLLSVS